MIRMNGFAGEPPELHQQELAAVERVLHSGRFILGPEGEQFEEAWAKFCGARCCAGVANGMEAIELGLRALDIGPGDEVITTPMTAMATIMAIMHTGATPVLADIAPDSALLDGTSAQRCLSPQTKAVLFVHLYGQIPEMQTWIDLCANAKIHLLEDAAQAHGAVRVGLHAGSFGSWAAYSFYPTKNLGAKGDAGALVTNSPDLAERVKALRNYGATKRDQHAEVGLNSRLDEMQAAILLARLPYLEQFNARRRQAAAHYFAAIKNPLLELLSPPDEPASHVYHLFVVRCAERDRLARFLLERDIESLVHYPIPAHRQSCCREVRIDPLGLTNAEKHATQCISVPCHPQLRDDEVASIIDALNAFA